MSGPARIHEYTPTKAPKLGGGRADRYAKFLVQELMPLIQTEYRVSHNPTSTGIGGSSLGGLVSLYLGLKLAQNFGRIAALSPSIWWHQRVILRFAASATPEPRPRIWLDSGTREGPRTLQDAERLRDRACKRDRCDDDAVPHARSLSHSRFRRRRRPPIIWQ